jgi:hypothetical protein
MTTTTRMTMRRNDVAFSHHWPRFVVKKKMTAMKHLQTIQKQNPCTQVLRRIVLVVDRRCCSCYYSEIAYWLSLKSCDCNSYFRSGCSHEDAKSGKKLHLRLQTELVLSRKSGSQARVQTEHLSLLLLLLLLLMLMLMKVVVPPQKTETMKYGQMKSPAIRNKTEMTASWTCSLVRLARRIGDVFDSAS